MWILQNIDISYEKLYVVTVKQEYEPLKGSLLDIFATFEGDMAIYTLLPARYGFIDFLTIRFIN